MIHEILLSLSGHPSPLLTTSSQPPDDSRAIVSPPEQRLLASAAHISHLHRTLALHSARVATTHPSTVCRAVATAIQTTHLAALRRKVLDVEADILAHDARFVGAYRIVPLTAVVGEFQPWTRRLEWLWEVVQFLEGADDDDDGGGGEKSPCWGARAIDRLRAELQSGYRDVQETARSLVAAAETAWLRQVSAWIFYGRLPGAIATSTGGGSGGDDDFFIRAAAKSGASREDEHYVIVPGLLPAFVTPATATSMLFIGRSLNQIRSRSSSSSGDNSLSSASGGLHNTAAKLRAVTELGSPLSSAALAGVVRDIRQSLSQDILEEILPLSQVVATLRLLRDFFLLGRGEFAMALTQEADERALGRWRRAGNLAHERDGGAGGGGVQQVTVKSGEVSAALARVWASLASFEKQQPHQQQSSQDEVLDRARTLLRLQLIKPTTAEEVQESSENSKEASAPAPPFHSFLFAVPVALVAQLPPPVEMVISPRDMQTYADVHAYLMSMRRAHIRLTDLWKLTSLRRHYPGAAATTGSAEVARLRERWSRRARLLRPTWTVVSAAVFFLGETETYFQMEVVEGLWRGFEAWLGREPGGGSEGVGKEEVAAEGDGMDIDVSDDDDDDVDDNNPTTTRKRRHDQQTLSAGHATYLAHLTHHLLLRRKPYTRLLRTLLVRIDQLVALVHRLHGVYTASDLETDAGVVDASAANPEEDEAELHGRLRRLERRVRSAMDDVVEALEGISLDEGGPAGWQDAAEGGAEDGEGDGGGLVVEEEAFRPERVGGLNRLLMQLKFGS